MRELSRDEFTELVMAEMGEKRYGEEAETGHEAVSREGLDGVLHVPVPELQKLRTTTEPLQMVITISTNKQPPERASHAGGVLFDEVKLLREKETTKSGGTKKMINFDDKAIKIVRDYIMEHLDKSDPMPDFTVFTVWKCKTLQNWKYLISSTLSDGMYYELTYNGNTNEWYLDAYKKFQNVVVKPITDMGEYK